MYLPAPSALTFALQSWHNARPKKDNSMQLFRNIQQIKKQIIRWDIEYQITYY